MATGQKRNVVFCSTVSESFGEDPAGSAWATRRITVAELPLPWPEDLLQSPHLPARLHETVHELYATLEEPWGLIGIAPDPDYSVPGLARVIDFRQTGAGARRYQRDSYLVPLEEIASILRYLAFEPAHPFLAAHRESGAEPFRDLLVCTHGSVDACCATFGVPMYKLLKAMASQAGAPTRVWRSTHFGGHRFAATALDLPDGRYWGHLKADMLSKLIHHRAPVRELRRHYRGWAALGHPLWQIAEAELFASAGWAWTDAAITSVTGDLDADAGGQLQITFTHPKTGKGAVDLALAPNGSVKTMDSSRTAELRDAPQFRATILRQSPTACLETLAAFGAASGATTAAGTPLSPTGASGV
jgi:hypothetical protein